MNDIKSELARKQAELKEIREKKQRYAASGNTATINQQTLNTSSSFNTSIQSVASANQSATNRLTLNEDADSILQSIGLSNLSARSSGILPQKEQTSSSLISEPSSAINRSEQQQSHPLNQQALAKKTQVPLQIVHINQISIPPKELVSYTKSTQTLPDIVPPPQSADLPAQYSSKSSQSNYYVLTDPYFEEEENYSDFQLTDRHNKSTSTKPPNNLPTPKTSVDDNAFQENQAEFYEYDEARKIRHVTEEERLQIESREDYQKFIDRATKVLERALCENESSDIFTKYFSEGENGEVNNDTKIVGKLNLNRVFYDERWSRDRCVTGFDWSSQYTELLLTSYFSNDNNSTDIDGVVLVWNTKFKNTTPEYVFHCQSPIMSCCFAKFHPSLIVGGTYSGQIALWDMRSHKKTPVQRSPSTAAAHTHPIYCTKIIGSQNAHNLISVSTDGKMCSWSLDMLTDPQETIELNQQKQTKSVAVTCMSFHSDDYNNFLVGSEEGTVYSGCRHGSKTGILSSYESHQGLVTAVDFRTNTSQSSYSNLFLTSSIDWTIKLWDLKEPEPLHSFESNCDYIYDVKWSPTHSGLFATVDGDGRVDIWNLINDSELPTASTIVEGQPSLNKLTWTPSGKQVVVGSDDGRVYVYDVGDVGDIGQNQRHEEKWSLEHQ